MYAPDTSTNGFHSINPVVSTLWTVLRPSGEQTTVNTKGTRLPSMNIYMSHLNLEAYVIREILDVIPEKGSDIPIQQRLVG